MSGPVTQVGRTPVPGPPALTMVGTFQFQQEGPEGLSPGRGVPSGWGQRAARHPPALPPRGGPAFRPTEPPKWPRRQAPSDVGARVWCLPGERRRVQGHPVQRCTRIDGCSECLVKGPRLWGLSPSSPHAPDWHKALTLPGPPPPRLQGGCGGAGLSSSTGSQAVLSLPQALPHQGLNEVVSFRTPLEDSC